MLSCTLTLPPGVTVGKGLWKLNCSLLQDKEVTKEYREQYREWQTLQDFFDSRAQWWEMVKEKTKTFFIRAGNRKKTKEKKKMVGLQKRLQRYFNLLNIGLDFNEEIKEVKKEMMILSEITSKGVILRSKEREVEEGEKCTRYFFKKIVSKSGAMVRIKNKEGILLTNTRDILNGVQEFYDALYEEKKIDEETLKEVLALVERTVKEKELLRSDFNILEITKGLKSFKKGKSPGADGLPLEFYETFLDILVEDLLVVFNDFDNSDLLPDSFRTGIVALLYKKGEKEDLQNWHPITLLNVDCKVQK